MSTNANLGVFLIFGIGLAVIVLQSVPRFRRRFEQRKARSWPTAHGQIDAADVVLEDRSFLQFHSDPSHMAVISYDYTVQGKKWWGGYTKGCYSEEEADEFIRDLKGKTLTVQYDPSDPESSVVLDSTIENLQRLRTESQSNFGKLPGWAKLILWPFLVLSAVGLALSLYVHIGAVLGRQVLPAPFFLGLSAGFFLVSLATAFAAQRLTGNLRRWDFWTVVLKRAQRWMGHVLNASFLYAVVNFFYLAYKAPLGEVSGNPPVIWWRGFSGGWIGLYWVEFVILWSAVRGRK